MKYFSPKTIHLWTTNNFSLYARFTPHAQRVGYSFFHFFNRYLRRLFKEVTIIIPVFLLALIFINFQVSKNSFEIAKEEVLLNPFNANSHYRLAKKFVATNQYSLAETELYQAIINSQSNEESLQYFEELKQIENIKNEPTKIRTISLFWQKIINQNSHYRDGYLQMAILNWKLYRPFDTAKFLSLAKEVDPNNQALKKFEDSLK